MRYAVIEKLLMLLRDAINAGKPPCIVGPTPLLARDRKAGGDSAVNVGDLPGVDVFWAN